MSEVVVDNARWAAARPVLSATTPFHHEDPRPLLELLAQGADGLAGTVELIVLDDGGGDERLARSVEQAIAEHPLPARFIRLLENAGRARVRNRFALEARGEHLLLLDSEKLPESTDFLPRWLDEARRGVPVAFGGFSLAKVPSRPETALHRRMAQRSNCSDLERRRSDPARYVFTGNILVSRELLRRVPFDPGFVGWGWEDVDWATRVSRVAAITQLENPVMLAGLDPAPVLAGKFEESVANYERILRAHPELVRSFTGNRVARVLARVPGRRRWRPLLRTLAGQPRMPLAAQALAMRLYRAALYTDVV